jgi:RNA polymerase sigma-70 factor, ECF subfamily
VIEQAETKSTGAENVTPRQLKKIQQNIDLKLVELAQQGDKKAFDELVRLHQKQIYYLALKILKNPDDAMDAVQEAFINAYRCISDFEGMAKFSSWIHRITVNVCLGRFRKKRIQIDDAKSQLLENHTAEDGDFVAYNNSPSKLMEDLDGEEAREVFRMELLAIIDSTVDQLSPDFQSVVMMRSVKGMSYLEIASALGIGEIAAKTRMHRARKELRELLSAHLGDDNIG